MSYPTWHEPKICVVVTEKQSVLSPRCKHSIRFVGIFRDEVIDEYTDIGLGPVEDEGRPLTHLQHGINTGN